MVIIPAIWIGAKMLEGWLLSPKQCLNIKYWNKEQIKLPKDVSLKQSLKKQLLPFHIWKVVLNGVKSSHHYPCVAPLVWYTRHSYESISGTASFQTNHSNVSEVLQSTWESSLVKNIFWQEPSCKMKPFTTR